MSEQPQWVEPFAGFEFTPQPVTITADFQREKLALCHLDTQLFSGSVDPSFYIAAGIHAGIRSGISAEGNVNMVQRLIQRRPVALDEPLTVRGRITALEEVPRGKTVDTEVWFEDSDHVRVAEASRRSLKPDPNRQGVRGAGSRPPPVVASPGDLHACATHQLTPEIVKGYTREGNAIHYDMAAANRAGFRAPLIGGGMGVHYLMAALWRERPPSSFDLDLYFRRPIFWDDQFVVRIDLEGLGAMALEREGKVLTEAAVNDLCAIAP